MKQIWVFGDAGVDVYYVGTARGISSEAPVPVMKITQVLPMPGMAANVTRLLSQLTEVNPFLHVASNLHAPVKNRLINQEGVQIARWDVEDYCTPLSEADWDRVLSLQAPDAIIVSDYSKGTIDELAVRNIRRLAESGVPLFVDTKGNPLTWVGLPQVTLFPNTCEYSQWKNQYDWMPQVVHKMSAAGAEILKFGQRTCFTPSAVRVVRNVCGAGDAVIAAFTVARLENCDDYVALQRSQIFAANLVETSIVPTTQQEATCN